MPVLRSIPGALIHHRRSITLALDGVYEGGLHRPERFLPLPPQEPSEVERVARLLVRRGLGADADLSLADPLPADRIALPRIHTDPSAPA
jgi:hypothetical protein